MQLDVSPRVGNRNTLGVKTFFDLFDYIPTHLPIIGNLSAGRQIILIDKSANPSVSMVGAVSHKTFGKPDTISASSAST